MGDATRGGEWAAVRLGRRRRSDRRRGCATGSSGSLEGLTLLEAAAVGGEPLASRRSRPRSARSSRAAPRTGPRRRRDERRRRQRGDAPPRRRRTRSASRSGSGRTRHGPSSERACCSAAGGRCRATTCHALGLPHVTLDLREEFREAVVDPFAAGYAAGDTPNPCARCNGAFRFDALLAFAERAGAETLWTGHYARVVERDGTLLVARASRPREGPVVHALDARSRRARARALPAGRADEGRDARRGGRRRARGGDTRREPGGLLPRGRRLSALSRAAGPARAARARSSTSTARSSAGTTATGRSRPASAGVSAWRPGVRCTSCAPTARAIRSSSATSRGARGDPRSTREGRLYVAVERARGEAPLPLGAGPRPSGVE